MIPHEAYVTVNGTRLFTRSVGEGTSTVVVLHGGPGANHDYLLPQFDDLAVGRRLAYYDQRGSGRSDSDRSETVTWKVLAEDLRALADEWRLDRLTIAGYSWGGLLAMLFAIEHPDRVGRLALVSPAPPSAVGRREFERRFAERMSHPEVVEQRRQLGESGLRESDPEGYRRRAFELSVAGYFHDLKRLGDLTPFRVTGRIQQSVWSSLGEYDVRPQLTSLGVPALVMHGVYDPIPIETARETAALLGARFVEMSESGHCPHVEQREEFATTLNAYLP